MNGTEPSSWRKDVLDYLEVPLRRPILVVVPFIVLTVAAVAVSYVLPKKYKSSTLILVESEKMPQAFVPSVATESSRQRLYTIKQEVLSRTRLERVIEDLDPYPEMRGQAATTSVVEKMRRAIYIAVRGGESFAIEYVHRDPVKTMQVANRLATLFIEETEAARQKQVKEASQFMDTQLAEARSALEAAEGSLRGLKERRMGSLPEQMGANLGTLHGLQLQQQSIAESLRAAQEREAVLERALADASRGSVSATAGRDSLSELSQLQSQLATLRGRYTDEHPDVRALLNRIARLEKAIEGGEAAERPVRAVDPATASLRLQLEQARAEVAGFKAKREEIDQRTAGLQARVEMAPRVEQELAAVKRDYDKLQQNYMSLYDKKLNAELSQKLEKKWTGEQFTVLDPAYLPTHPVFPNRFLFLMAGMVAGLAAGLVLAFGVEMLDHSVKSVRDLEAVLPYPLLVTIPHLGPNMTLHRAAAAAEAQTDA